MNDHYYTTGQLAQRARVSLRTIRWYDRQGLLEPSVRTEGGRRLYSEQDLAKLRQILLFRSFGFSLEDIREMTLGNSDRKMLEESLRIQQKLVEERIGEYRNIHSALQEILDRMEQGEEVSEAGMIDFMQRSMDEETLKLQYQNDANISARIRLHSEYSVNPERWFLWLYRQYPVRSGMKILEVGCGNGTLWKENIARIPDRVSILLSDVSEGMVHECQKNFSGDPRFAAETFDAAEIPLEEDTFDLVIANHMLFYCMDLPGVLAEIRRVLKPGGTFAASTYSRDHMKEIRELVQEFDPQIQLSEEPLYEKFGKENGKGLLSPYFSSVEYRSYEDAIEIDDPMPLISYILSCHGNQNRILVDRYREFRAFISEKTAGGFHITKDAGTFLAEK